jgi:hypothetical protein
LGWEKTVMKDSDEQLLEQYLRLPDQLEAVLTGLDEASLDLTKGEGWSIRETACHVLEGESLWQLNLRIIAAQNGIEIPFLWYFSLTQDEWAARWGYGKRSLETILGSYRASTKYLVEFLCNVPDIWENYGLITWRGSTGASRMTVRQIAEMNIRHLGGHLQDIQSIQEAHRR